MIYLLGCLEKKRNIKKDFFLSWNVYSLIAVVVQSLSCVWLFVIPWTATHLASLSFTISWSLLKFMSIGSVMPSSHLILYCPLLLLPSVFPSIRVLSNELALSIRWSNYWSFSFSISPSSEYSGLISFITDWFDLLAVQGTLKSILQHHSSKASILWCSLSLLYTWLLVKPYVWLFRPLLQSGISDFLILCLGLLYLFFQGSGIV